MVVTSDDSVVIGLHGQTHGSAFAKPVKAVHSVAGRSVSGGVLPPAGEADMCAASPDA